jgi:urease accessory protein
MSEGRLRLAAAVRGGRTVLTDVYRTAPFHPGPPHYRAGMAEVILQEVSPGHLPGDRLTAEVQVADGGALVVTGQGATRLYPSTNGGVAEARTSLTVRGGTLWWLPGPLIPFRDACYEARTNVGLAEGSRFAHLEVITPGRSAMGERFAYQRLDLRLRINVDGRPRFVERTLLDPRERPLTAIGRQGEFPCAGSLVMMGYPVPSMPDYPSDDIWLGADGSPSLAIVRGLARSAEALREALLGMLRAVANPHPSPLPRRERGWGRGLFGERTRFPDQSACSGG